MIIEPDQIRRRGPRVDGAAIGDDRGFFARAWCEEEFRARRRRHPRTSRRTCRFNRAARHDPRPALAGRALRRDEAAALHARRRLRRRRRPAARLADLRPLAGRRAARRATGRLVFVPAGCAHGYQALEDDAEVSYQVSHPYVPGAERGIRWNDPALRHRVADRRGDRLREGRVLARLRAGAGRMIASVRSASARGRAMPRGQARSASGLRRGRLRRPRLRRCRSSAPRPGMRRRGRLQPHDRDSRARLPRRRRRRRRARRRARPSSSRRSPPGRHAVTDDPGGRLRGRPASRRSSRRPARSSSARRSRCWPIEHGKHLVLVNAELDSTLGPILKTYADAAGVVLTDMDGDQPACIMNLVREVADARLPADPRRATSRACSTTTARPRPSRRSRRRSSSGPR